MKAAKANRALTHGMDERAMFTARRKRLYVLLHPETALGENQHTRVRQNGEPSPKRFTEDTAEKTGRAEPGI